MSGSRTGAFGGFFLALASAGLVATPAMSQEYCKTSMGSMTNGYHYEMWIAGGINGTACMNVLGEDARFQVNWNMSNYGFVARVGRKYDETRTHEQIGWITSEFAHTRTGTGTAWVGIYGWMIGPLTEYYIIEDWQGYRPSYPKKGTITVDGGEYDVYTNTQVNQPSVKGTTTFGQWYSVRKAQRQSGTITISEHFEKWKALGMEQGKMYEVKLKVEGLSGSGSVDFSRATVVTGVKPITVIPAAKISPVRPAAKGVDAKGRKLPAKPARLLSF